MHRVMKKFALEGNVIDRTNCKVSVNDIVVIELNDDIIFNNFTRPANIAHKCENIDKDVLVDIVGWGGRYAECRHEIEIMTVPMLDLECCNATFQGTLKNGHFCAGYKDPMEQDGHLADLGDLMIHDDRIVGIVTYDTSCDEESKPIVYTDVGYYHQFIAYHAQLKYTDKNGVENRNL